ncbi:sensor histidine kinase [Actinoplanes couchii]|uniref:histidine kinase n=1 Tax=Actinoplanes couchii TaxID=403638 RepID=A0ABQ3XT78_9ACTN|nr:ATP-binding protein [Actinoplanes couchii]MDR6317036.1 two-component system sensor histidine kinase BaeS [Actinoplanes couchii]GID61716.1 two-component sensor histidine kinase [Actinoplanes couchii]
MAERRRSSLLVRLLAVSAVVSLLSVAATAWLAVRTTTRAIQQEQGQALSDEAKIYDTLIGYAATHRDWSGAGPLVTSLATSTGHRVTLTGRAGEPIADSGTGSLPGKPLATVDPLLTDEGIDARAVGPFRLTAAEQEELRVVATRVRNCLRDPPGGAALVHNADIVEEPNGRSRLEVPGGDLSTDTACVRPRAVLDEPVTTERRALTKLGTLVNACLARQDVPAVTIGLSNTWTWADPVSARTGQNRNQVVADCLTAGRREQLASWVAPAALLFVTVPDSPVPATAFDLSLENRIRILAVTGLVLLAAVGVTTLAGMRLVRPLRALTAAAGRMRDGDATARVEASGRDEIARLADAFNDMSQRRQHVEQLRHAMVGDIAHEMRTPVTNIRGWLEAAHDGVVPLDRELMASLLEEALLLQHVIDDLQDLSAADAGELRLHPQPVEIASLLSGVADAFHATAEKAEVTLTVRTAPATITADPIRLRQAVGNLMANAIRHTPPGGQVTISSVETDSELTIAVTDTGPGLPPDQLELVFERFWRAEKSRSRQTGGSGLGLSIVRKLTEAHHGRVSVTSPPGEGATFTLHLPL